MVLDTLVPSRSMVPSSSTTLYILWAVTTDVFLNLDVLSESVFKRLKFIKYLEAEWWMVSHKIVIE